MNRLKKPICILLLFFSLQGLSQGFSPFELLTPKPVEGENIQIYYSGCDSPSPNLFTGEYYYVEQDGSVINVIVYMAPGLPTCPFGYEYYYDVTGFLAGAYQIDLYVMSNGTPYPVDLSDRTPFDSYFVNIAGTPLLVPSTNNWGLMLLILLLIAITFFIFRQKELK